MILAANLLRPQTKGGLPKANGTYHPLNISINKLIKGDAMLDEYADILTVDDLCSILDICSTTVYKYLNDGTIPSRRIGKKFYVSKRVLIDYINNPKV